MPDVPRRQLLNVPIDDCSLPQAMQLCELWLRDGGFHHIATTGPEFILEAQDNPRFHTILNKVDLSLADGMGVKVGFLVQGFWHRHRVTGVDFVLSLMRLAARDRRSVFLFGAKQGVAEAAAAQLSRQFPGLVIAGVESGSRWPWTPLTNRRIVERIHLARPDILLVALGAPKQEIWIDAHREELHDVRIAVGVGRTFDYLAGSVARPPRWIRRIGMEWLYTFFRAGSFKGQMGDSSAARRRRRVVNATWTFLRSVLNQ